MHSRTAKAENGELVTPVIYSRCAVPLHEGGCVCVCAFWKQGKEGWQLEVSVGP